MSKKPSYSVDDQKIDLVATALDYLRCYSHYGLTEEIVEVRQFNRTDEWPADFEVTLKCRKKRRKCFLFVKVGPSKPLTEHMENLLTQFDITPLFINVYSKFKSILKELALSLKRKIHGPFKRTSNSRCPRSFHPRAHGTQFAHAA